MRKVILISVCLIISVLAFATKIDTVQVKGYYTVAYPKEQILKGLDITMKYYETGIRGGGLMEYGKSFKFVPLQVDTAIINTDSTISKTILRDSSVLNLWESNAEYFMSGTYVCSKSSVEYDIKRYFGIKINLYKVTAIFSNFDKWLFFYANNRNPDYLYIITYIEGTALKIVLPHDPKILPFCIDLGYTIKKEFDPVELYYIIDITKYNPIVNLEGFDFWYPYIDS